MKVGFTGTQNGMTGKQHSAVWEIIAQLKPSEFHHGDCVGADEQAHDIAARLGFKPIHTHPPLKVTKRAFCAGDVMHDPEEYLARNRHIVDETEVLIAAPKGQAELRSGTWSTVRYARKLGRPVYIVMPNGTVLPPHR